MRSDGLIPTNTVVDIVAVVVDVCVDIVSVHIAQWSLLGTVGERGCTIHRWAERRIRFG